MLFPPLKCTPLFKPKIWGSDRLGRLLNKAIGPGEKIGESWELADLPQGQTVISGGAFDGMTIRQILDAHGLEMGFAPSQCQAPFGLLIKYLDANELLSVQVHPDEYACRGLPEAKPKTECWFVIDASAESVIYRGLKPNVTKRDVKESLKYGNIETLMNCYPARKGDFHFLPAGTLHALGSGIIIAEIQTPSDTTYRLYDWGRTDPQGPPRPLHISEAIESIHYTDTNQIDAEYPDNTLLSNIASLWENAFPLINCPYFEVWHTETQKEQTLTFQGNPPFVMMILSGRGELANLELTEAPCRCETGDTFLIPSMNQGQIRLDQPGEFLLITTGQEKDL